MTSRSFLSMMAAQTRISPENAEPVLMAIGPDQIYEAAFRKDAPRASELEAAINLVEDALMTTGLRTIRRGALISDAQALHKVFLIGNASTTLSLAQVEQRYQDVAQAAQRLPSASISEPAPFELASLILVRECMHHLGYEELVLV